MDRAKADVLQGTLDLLVLEAARGPLELCVLRAVGQRAKLEHRIPVASSASRLQMLFDESARQAGLADSVGVDDVRVRSIGAHDFAAGDGLLQRRDRSSTGR